MNNDILKTIKDRSYELRYGLARYCMVDIDIEKMLKIVDWHNLIGFNQEDLPDSTTSSIYIESIFLGLPLMALAAEETITEESSLLGNPLKIIDGAKMLTAIRGYVNDEFALTGLAMITELNNYAYKDLHPALQKHISRKNIRTMIIPDQADNIELFQQYLPILHNL